MQQPPGPDATVTIVPARADITIPGGGPLGSHPVTFDVQAFILRRGDEVAVVDTLIAGHIHALDEALGLAGGSHAAIRYIILTHHHQDHTGGLTDLAQRAPQARILAGGRDVDAIRSDTGIGVDGLEDGDTVFGLDVIATPGHTPGHISLLDPQSSTLFLGDVVGNIGALDRGPAAFTHDSALAERSLRALAERQFDVALPSHGGPLSNRASDTLGAFVRGEAQR